MESLVSIVTPCYNGEKYLGRFLDSIISQTYPHIELVLINDGSTDNTEQVFNEYRSHFIERGIKVVYHYQNNAGQAAALNSGLKLFTGDYLVWVDSDDELSANFVETRKNFLETNSEYSFCYGKAFFVAEDKPEAILGMTSRRENRKGKDFFEDVLYVRGIFFSGYMARVKALDKVLPHRDIFAGEGGQNAQLLLPLSWYYGEPGYVEESYYKYYVRSNSHSHSQKTGERIIQQLLDYEQILIETINRIEDKQAMEYIQPVKQHYARLRFGNAVDTKDAELIKKYYHDLKEINADGIKDWALYMKYASAVGKAIFGKR